MSMLDQPTPQIDKTTFKSPKYIREQLKQIYRDHPNPPISYSVFYSRVQYLGWDVISALTTAIAKEFSHRPRGEIRQFYDDNVARAQVNLNVYNGRVRMGGWDKEKALTTPVGARA